MDGMASCTEPTLQTQKAVHILVTTNKDGRIQTALERKIPLVTIRSIGMSYLRDDWIVCAHHSPRLRV